MSKFKLEGSKYQGNRIYKFKKVKQDWVSLSATILPQLRHWPTKIDTLLVIPFIHPSLAYYGSRATLDSSVRWNDVERDIMPSKDAT